MIALIIIAAVLALGLFLVAPSARHSRADGWRGTCFAHRGLHGGGRVENTIEAFAAARDAGFGIELDVQLSRDGAVVVFHDDDLKRMTGDARRVDHVDLAELQSIPLAGSGRMPTFAEVLECVGGRVPLLVEIKSGPRNARLCADTLALLRGYNGNFIVESFNPVILRWFRKNAPDIVRGQLVGIWSDYLASVPFAGAFLLSTLSLNFLARPDFIAYDVSARRFAAPRVQRAIFDTPLAAWTVRDPATFAACLERREMPIFEGFVPPASPNPADE